MWEEIERQNAMHALQTTCVPIARSLLRQQSACSIDIWGEVVSQTKRLLPVANFTRRASTSGVSAWRHERNFLPRGAEIAYLAIRPLASMSHWNHRPERARIPKCLRGEGTSDKEILCATPQSVKLASVHTPCYSRPSRSRASMKSMKCILGTCVTPCILAATLREEYEEYEMHTPVRV